MLSRNFWQPKKYVDMLHKETGELLVNLLIEKDKQIAELQYQLEARETQKRRHFEKVKILDKENKELKELLEEVQAQYEYECECNKQFVDCQRENVQLKKSQKQLVINEFEKLKDFFIEEPCPCLRRDEEMGTEFLITKDTSSIADYVLDRIKKLKGEKK